MDVTAAEAPSVMNEQMKDLAPQPVDFLNDEPMAPSATVFGLQI